jgi:hypothetical protein
VPGTILVVGKKKMDKALCLTLRSEEKTPKRNTEISTKYRF